MVMIKMDPMIIIGVVALVFVLLVLVAYTSSRRQPSNVKKTENQPEKEKTLSIPETVKQKPEPNIETEKEEPSKDMEAEAKSSEVTEIEDLDELSGIGEKYRALLRAAGVKSVSSLSKQDPEKLLTKLTETNEKNEIVKRLPSAKIVEDWVERAKESIQ